MDIMNLLTLLLLSLLLIKLASPSNNVFNLIGMFSTNTPNTNIRETYGIYPLVAARLAVEHVRAEGLLTEQNFNLQLVEIETSCEQIGGVLSMFKYYRTSSEFIESYIVL